MEAYGYGIIQNCDGLFQSLEKEGFGVNDFLTYAKDLKNKKIDEFKKKEIDEKKVKKQIKKSIVKSKFLVPGELEIMKGIVCSKCGNEVYTTVVCCSNPLKAQGFLRKTICSSCGLETGQK